MVSSRGRGVILPDIPPADSLLRKQLLDEPEHGGILADPADARLHDEIGAADLLMLRDDGEDAVLDHGVGPQTDPAEYLSARLLGCHRRPATRDLGEPRSRFAAEVHRQTADPTAELGVPLKRQALLLP